MSNINSVLDTMRYVLNDAGNYIKNMAKYEGPAAQRDKLFTELVLFDRSTFQKLHPFISGRYIFLVGTMPKMMEMLYPKETAYMKMLFSTCTLSIEGFTDQELEVSDVQAMTDQNTASYITKLTGRTNSITIRFMSEYTSLVITNYITTWMHAIYDPGSSAAGYSHITGLEYNEGNHSMTAVYAVTNPSYQVVEIGAVFYGMVPTTNSQSALLDNTLGQHEIEQLSITFKVHTYTTALPNVMEICKKALDDYVNMTAIIDYRVQKTPLKEHFGLVD